MLEYALAESIIGREVGTGVPLLGVDIRNVRSEHAPDGLVALTSRQVNLRPDTCSCPTLMGDGAPLEGDIG